MVLYAVLLSAAGSSVRLQKAAYCGLQVTLDNRQGTVCSPVVCY